MRRLALRWRRPHAKASAVGRECQVGRRQWAGVIITAFGLAVIAITGGQHTSAVRHYSLAALIAVECGIFALVAAGVLFGVLIGTSMHGRVGPAAEGLLLGVSDNALKYLTEALHGGLHGVVSEWTLAALAASVLAFYASARGLQLGPGVAVIAFTSVAANLAAIMGGILVFRDPIGIGALAIVGQGHRLLPRHRRRGHDAGAAASRRDPRRLALARSHARPRGLCRSARTDRSPSPVSGGCSPPAQPPTAPSSRRSPTPPASSSSPAG